MEQRRKYIIHSGWWCDEARVHPGSLRNDSDNRVRSPLFFDVWYEAIDRFANPAKIIVIDSASPVRPPLKPAVEFISLERNYLHAENVDTRYTGWTRAFMAGAFYALMNDAEYSVYIEQDCVIWGDGIIERVIGHLESSGKKIAYGGFGANRELIEQSFVVIKNEYILEFLTKYISIPLTDNFFNGMAPEIKFKHINKNDGQWLELPYGYGRRRPIDFSASHFYAQQLNVKELYQLYRLSGFESLKKLLAAE
jgi:hypothetical protein